MDDRRMLELAAIAVAAILYLVVWGYALYGLKLVIDDLNADGKMIREKAKARAAAAAIGEQMEVRG